MIFVAIDQPVYQATVARVLYSVACHHHRVESEEKELFHFRSQNVQTVISAKNGNL
jgi:hypothetical protein